MTEALAKLNALTARTNAERMHLPLEAHGLGWKADHSRRTGIVVARTCEELGLSALMSAGFALGPYIHDAIYTPELAALLNAPRALSPGERAVVGEHPRLVRQAAERTLTSRSADDRWAVDVALFSSEHHHTPLLDLPRDHKHALGVAATVLLQMADKTDARTDPWRSYREPQALPEAIREVTEEFAGVTVFGVPSADILATMEQVTPEAAHVGALALSA